MPCGLLLCLPLREALDYTQTGIQQQCCRDQITAAITFESHLTCLCRKSRLNSSSLSVHSFEKLVIEVMGFDEVDRLNLDAKRGVEAFTEILATRC